MVTGITNALKTVLLIVMALCVIFIGAYALAFLVAATCIINPQISNVAIVTMVGCVILFIFCFLFYSFLKKLEGKIYGNKNRNTVV